MSQTKGNILIVDDDIDILEMARMFLKQYYLKKGERMYIKGKLESILIMAKDSQIK